MRILVIWAESLTKPGAGTTHAVGLIRHWVRAGHQVTTISPVYGQRALRAEGIDVTPVRLPPRGWLSFGRMQAATVLCLPRWIARYRPDAIYVRTCFLQGLMALIARTMGVPLVGEVDSMVDDEILQRGQPAWLSWLARGLDRVNFRLSSGLVCVTRGLRDEAIRRGGPRRTTVAIHNGVATDVMQPTDRQQARKRLGLSEGAVIFGFVGSMVAWQGLDYLIEAADQLHRRRPDIRVAMMGAGPQADEVRSWIQQRGLSEMFTLLPPGSQAEVAEFLNACDATVLPIHDRRRLRYGSSALKFWDAVSVGLPVLVARGAQLDDVLADLGLPGEFDPASPASLAAAMEAVAGQTDAINRRRAEVHALVRAKYSWQRVAEEVARFLAELTHGR